SLLYLWKNARTYDLWAHASAEVGVVFCTVVLLTGPIWARPVWGVWWTWDARLTTTLVLWLIYVGYLMLRAYVPEPERQARYAAVVGIVGFLDVPIVHLSVVWWRTLHPGPTVLRRAGLADLPGSMHVALWSMLLALTLLFLFLLRQRAGLERERDLLAALKARAGE
ncbi:MAG: cytochrome c biogenesis protein CcsA, partial [Nitrospinota bacterium]